MTSKPEIKTIPGHRPEGWKFLENQAFSLGFSAVGVVDAGPIPAQAATRYSRWINCAYHSDMSYMSQNIQLRTNTSHPNILKGTNIVIVAAFPYDIGTEQSGLWQYVACHARGKDYHFTLKKKLKHLAGCIAEHFHFTKYRTCVDSAPVMERTLAYMSGLGNIGKNGSLLVDGVGPRVLIGEIFVAGIPAPPSPPSLSPPFSCCGPCTTCIDACPTHAIVEPGLIDSRKCLSYWTVERKTTAVPPNIARHLTQIFGCDICTTVCPLNKRTTPPVLEPTNASIPLPQTLEAFLISDDDKLIDAFSGTTLLRSGIQTLKQNARIVMDNMRTSL